MSVLWRIIVTRKQTVSIVKAVISASVKLDSLEMDPFALVSLTYVDFYADYVYCYLLGFCIL